MIKSKTSVSAIPCRVRIGGNMLRIVICDDDQLFAEKLRNESRAIMKRLDTKASIHVMDSQENISEMLFAGYDLALLDVDFSDMGYTGIDLAKMIRAASPKCVIVFVSNYIEYAPEGYEVQAFRYLLKSEIASKLETCLRDSLDRILEIKETLSLKVGGEGVSILLQDILYIAAEDHNVVIYTRTSGENSEKTYRAYATLGEVEKKLEARGFLRIQKSYLVNMRRLQKFQCQQAVLDNGCILPVSEKTYAVQKKKYLMWKGLL